MAATACRARHHVCSFSAARRRGERSRRRAGLKRSTVGVFSLPAAFHRAVEHRATSIARGNVAAAICAASASNILGVFLTPLLAGFLLHTAGVTLGLDAFRDIILQLLAPFALGQMLRPWIGNWVARHKSMLSYFDRGSILLIIYLAFSKGMNADIWNQIAPLHLAILCLFLLALLWVVLAVGAVLARKVLGFNRADSIVLQFCGSNKSLASGLPMASVIFTGPQMGLIILPLMLFHQFQLVVCAILARRYANEGASETPANEAPAASGADTSP